MRLVPTDIAKGWYADEALSWAAMRTVNYLPEAAESEGTRTVSKLATPPGLRVLVDLQTNAPVRGIEDVEGRLFVVSGTSLFEITSGLTKINRGTIPGVGRVSMAHNKQGGTSAANELAIANGLSGYVYNTSSTTLTQITDSAFEGASTFDYIDGYSSFTDPQGRFWGHSELNQALQYSSIDRYDAESAPDKITSHIVSHREVIVWGPRTGEFFRNTGAATGTFQRVDGTEMEVGICSTFARARVDNTVCWVGNDMTVYRLDGHSPRRISTRPIEQVLSKVDPNNVFCYAWEDRGHKVFYVTSPNNFTLGFDFASGLWHERESYGLNQWRVNALTRWNGLWVAGDYVNGLLYALDWDVYTENGRPMVSEAATGYTVADQNKVIAAYVELIFDTGGPETSAPGVMSLTGDVLDGTVGDVVNVSYAASGGVPPYTYTIIAGSLPPGLTLNPSTGAVTGTYTTAGSYSWTVEATDDEGNTATLNDSNVVASLSLLPVARTDNFGFSLAATSVTVNQDASWQSTDYIVFGVSASIAAVINPPGGITAITSINHPSDSTLRLYVFGGFKGATTSWQFTWTGSATVAGVAANAISNIDTVSPIISATTLSGTNSTSIDVKSSTVSVTPRQAHAVMLFAADKNMPLSWFPVADVGKLWVFATSGPTARMVAGHITPISADTTTYRPPQFLANASGNCVSASVLLRRKLGSPPAPSPNFASIGTYLNPLSVGWMWAASLNGTIVSSAVGGLARSAGAPSNPSVPFSLDLVLPIASISKLVTEFALRLLAQNGLVNLSNTAFSYIGSDFTFGSGANAITLQNLLSMQHGISATYTLTGTYPSAMQTWINNTSTNPGSHYFYENGAFAVLQAVIEKVTGSGYAAWVQSNIFAPLDITDAANSPSSSMPRMYSGTGDAVGAEIFAVPATSTAGWCMSARSALKLAAALRNTTLLNAGNLQTMLNERDRAQSNFNQRAEVHWHEGDLFSSGKAIRCALFRLSDGYDVFAYTNTEGTSGLFDVMRTSLSNV